jgi:hypothetical protein
VFPAFLPSKYFSTGFLVSWLPASTLSPASSVRLPIDKRQLRVYSLVNACFRRVRADIAE